MHEKSENCENSHFSHFSQCKKYNALPNESALIVVSSCINAR